MRARFRIQGRVQGVGFREWVRFRAKALGLSGWIRNEEDGSVAGLAEGSADSMRTFKELLGLGPEQAQVRHLSWDLDREDGEGGESLPLPFEIQG